MRHNLLFTVPLAIVVSATAAHAALLRLEGAQIVLRGEAGDPVTMKAAQVLAEEVERRTGIVLPVVAGGTPQAPRIVLHADAPEPAAPPDYHALPRNHEAFSLRADKEGVEVRAAVPHALLFGVGLLLQRAAWAEGRFGVPEELDVSVHPELPLRGHQLGYRARSNSWDAWTVAEFDQHIRELALFGTNAIENIPFQDEDASVHFKVARREMNREMSRICRDYGLQYWVWTPADFDLADAEKRAAHLALHEQLYRDCPRLDGVFFPGGDPGDNPAELVLPYLEELGGLLRRHHPHAGVWLSLQGFDPPEIARIYAYLDREKPAWLAGIVGGPSSPPLKSIRKRLDARYPLRDYPDITHTTRCQYPVPWWDPAYALTLGRECINPRPRFYAEVIRAFGRYTCGFISYSDGVHDDVNKAVWSRLGMRQDEEVQTVLEDYARFFFGPAQAGEIAAGILALEENWNGPLAEHRGVEETLARWNALEAAVPRLGSQWRGQMLLLRAEYDAYTRRRLLAETAAEAAWMEDFRNAGEAAADEARLDALLARINAPVDFEGRTWLRDRIVARFDRLFDLVGLQSSVEKYHASGSERGCSLDFLDYPLNNRWWLSDRIAALRGEGDLALRAARLREAVLWEDPGPGGFYDVVGHPGRNPRVVRRDRPEGWPDLDHALLPTQWWWDGGYSRARLTWQISLDWPEALRYTGLDPAAQYVLRCTGYGEALPKADGERLEATRYEKELGGIKEFPIPRRLSRDGELRLTWTRPGGEAHLNWRQQSRLAEVWLIKHE